MQFLHLKISTVALIPLAIRSSILYFTCSSSALFTLWWPTLPAGVGKQNNPEYFTFHLFNPIAILYANADSGNGVSVSNKIV